MRDFTSFGGFSAILRQIGRDTIASVAVLFVALRHLDLASVEARVPASWKGIYKKCFAVSG
jgi:hypothetical protein